MGKNEKSTGKNGVRNSCVTEKPVTSRFAQNLWEPDAALSCEKLSDIRKTRHEIRVLNWQVLNLLQNVVLNLDSNNYRFLRRSAQDGTSDWSPKMGPGTEQSRIMTTSNFIKRGWKILCFEDFPKSSFNWGIFQPCCIECEKLQCGDYMWHMCPQKCFDISKIIWNLDFSLGDPIFTAAATPQRRVAGLFWTLGTSEICQLDYPASVGVPVEFPKLVNSGASSPSAKSLNCSELVHGCQRGLYLYTPLYTVIHIYIHMCIIYRYIYI